ncbi:hypothetical protein OS493_040077 [Desmophyllum pertusum]|uniref:Uncharacterized protein n=1 Tax=Desmophyllum pertusum TaxID=174260 RepID=A0A9W9Z7Y2_9CNID|nr:hypothetical protein OS493_040077 [Desmophyllum pertusum]
MVSYPFTLEEVYQIMFWWMKFDCRESVNNGPPLDDEPEAVDGAEQWDGADEVDGVVGKGQPHVEGSGPRRKWMVVENVDNVRGSGFFF